LAAVGLYGVISYTVSTRTGEIGIRMALGASRAGILALIARDMAVPLSLGVMGGLIAALATGGLLRTMLFDLTPTDTVTFATATVALMAVACLATLLPARRAVRVDPTAALRNE
jgi:putative ABC transport system permease protein